MGHRGGRNRNRSSKPEYVGSKQGHYDNTFWQSPVHNDRLYWYYYNIIQQLAMNRFRWVGLPKTCDARYLELTLLNQGIATIAFPRKMRGTFFSTQAILSSPPNVNDNYTHWESFGNNGWRFDCDMNNGVLVWDNCTRTPLSEGIDLYATELVHIRITKQMNRFHQQVPWILRGPQERMYDMQQITKQVAGGELAMIATDGLSSITTDALQTGVPYLGEELAADESQTWNRIYTMLGIDNNPFKQERQTSDEIMSQREPSTFIRMASLAERRKACDYLNDRFGNYLDEEIKCVWNADNESDNWNFQRSIKQQIDAIG